MKALILNFLFCKYLKLLIKLVLNCHFNSIKMQTSNLITKLYLFSVSKATTCAVKQLKILIFVLKTEKLSKLTHTQVQLSLAYWSIFFPHLSIHFISLVTPEQDKNISQQYSQFKHSVFDNSIRRLIINKCTPL